VSAKVAGWRGEFGHLSWGSRRKSAVSLVGGQVREADQDRHPVSRLLMWRPGGRLERIALACYGGEPVFGVVELAGDHFLDVWVERGVRAEDELAQYWGQGAVLAGQRS
jgi:hypothetical protein